MKTMIQTETLIVGASISGLASAAALKKRGTNYIILEKEAQIAMPWRNHYDRLHLHTDKHSSRLPYKKFGAGVPLYPSRQQVVDYVDDYQRTFAIQPIFNTGVKSIIRDGGHWIAETNNGAFRSKYVIIATGPYGRPKPIYFRGIETFPGKILHSYGYKTGRHFKGQRVLVVGFGNSACEIAIDLHEQGAMPAMAVRSPVNVVPRDLFGIPIIRISLMLARLPTTVADTIQKAVTRLVFGDLSKIGLRQMQTGVFSQIQNDAKIPLLDVGTIRLIREGHIGVYPGIECIRGAEVTFSDGRKNEFDAIVAAIGYERTYADFLPALDAERVSDLKLSVDHQKYFGRDGLYFCGFWIGPTGEFREIRLDAQKIAADIFKRR
jgi:indole-3-pyruvate monooxygenase